MAISIPFDLAAPGVTGGNIKCILILYSRCQSFVYRPEGAANTSQVATTEKQKKSNLKD